MIITWLKHASFKIQVGEKHIYIDPYIDPFSAEKYEKADLILISHWHYSHCTLESVRRLKNEGTVIFGTREVNAQIDGCQVLYPGQDVTMGNVTVTPVKAVSSKPKHKGVEMIGFVIASDGKTIYYPSDTELHGEVPMGATVVLVPVSGSSVMNPQQAAQFINVVKPTIAIPMHYGSMEGTEDDAYYFKELVEKQTQQTNVLILKPFKPFEFK